MSYKTNSKTEDCYDRWSRLSIYNHKRKGFDVQLTQGELADAARVAIRCKICGCRLRWDARGLGDLSPTLDRVNNECSIRKDNSHIICWRCNRVKGTMSMNEFIFYCNIVSKISKGERIDTSVLENMLFDRVKTESMIREIKVFNKLLSERIENPRSIEDIESLYFIDE